MPKNTFSYIRRATTREKYLMAEWCKAQNDFQQQEPHGWDENGEDFPVTFKPECHSRYWQAQSYSPSGAMIDFHKSFIRSNCCGEVFTYGGDDDTVQFCPNCYSPLEFRE